MIPSDTRATRRGAACTFLLIAGALAWSGCRGTQAEPETAAAPDVAEVEKRSLDIKAEAAGLVEPITTIEVKSKASGEVTAVLVETGQEVTRGTLLVEIEPRDVRNSYAQADADLEVAKARAQTSEAQFKRAQELRKANVATEQELESAQLESANSRASLIKAQTNLELSRERMNDVTIRAPLNGTVIEKTVEPGNIIASASGTFGGGSTLLKMADLSTVQVRALVDQTDIGRVQPGQTARVTVEAYPNRPFEGKVVKIEPQAVVDQNVTMFPVLIHLENSERLLKPGMNTEIEIEIARKADAVVVPNDAIVAMRDMMSVATALGLSEESVREKMTAMRPMGGGANEAAPGAGTHEAPIPATPVASRPAGGQQPAVPASPAGAQNGGQNGTRPQASQECRDLFSKLRDAGGAQNASAEDQKKMEACRAQMRAAGPMPGNTGEAGRANASSADGQRGQNGAMRGQGGGFQFGAMNGRRPRGTSRTGVVFVPTATGAEPRMVTLGVNDWEWTEVLSGLDPGEKVYLVTAVRLAQQEKEQNERMRQRSGGPVPGMQRQTTPQGGTQPGRGGR